MIQKTNSLLFFLAFIFLFSNCDSPSNRVTNNEDYNKYLDFSDENAETLVHNDLLFWKAKLENTPDQFPFQAKVASAQTQLFHATGRIEYLIEAEQNLLEVNRTTNYNKAGYLRSLARNYISQHKFKQALNLLRKAETNGENLKGTQKMLFDVYLELGDISNADKYLGLIKDLSDFDYLIRLAKWSDHKGNLEAAIHYMERATVMAEDSNLKSLKKWAYTNLADFYGHDGQIDKSYNLYLKALSLDPSDAYSKKGIAWIVFSLEHNPDEALRIINSITENYDAPDYYLLKAEIAEYKGDIASREANMQAYFTEMEEGNYGDMYNKHNALIYSEDEKSVKTAIEIATIEIKNRPTPQSYDLLAWAYYKDGRINEALGIIEMYVVNKTFEPKALYHVAKIYKANGKFNEAKSLKKELMSSAFELGPTTAEEVKNI